VLLPALRRGQAENSAGGAIGPRLACAAVGCPVRAACCFNGGRSARTGTALTDDRNALPWPPPSCSFGFVRSSRPCARADALPVAQSAQATEVFEEPFNQANPTGVTSGAMV